MTESDFNEWKAHPITKQIFTTIANRVHDHQVALGLSAGLDPREDAKQVGAIQAYRNLLEMEFDEETR